MWKKILLLLFLGGAVAGYFGYEKYKEIFKPNVPQKLETSFLHVPSNATYTDLKNLLYEGNFIVNKNSFEWVADQMKFSTKAVRAGRFKIKPGWSNRKLISHLRAGKQATVKVVLNNERLLSDVAGKVSKVIEADSLSIMEMFDNKDFLQKYDLTQESIMSTLIPNTYDFFWNTSATRFFEKMQKEKEKFWTKKQRREKAKSMGFSENEIYTLASIVERETLKKDEKPRIAGVYLNRLEKGMLLQADPTVVFANGDFGLRRVLTRHLEFDSPYNTYKYAGLPPGPISMASIASLDAVLDAEDHNFLYFCAKPDNSGYHAFAKNLTGHNRNADKYRQWLNVQRIR